MTKSVLVARLVLWAASKSLSFWLCSAIIITERNQRASVMEQIGSTESQATK